MSLEEKEDRMATIIDKIRKAKEEKRRIAKILKTSASLLVVAPSKRTSPRMSGVKLQALARRMSLNSKMSRTVTKVKPKVKP
jgi:hypothetical protein